MWLGKSYYAADPYLGGRIDEVAIFNRAISQAEIDTTWSIGWQALSGRALTINLNENPASNGTNLGSSIDAAYGGMLVTDDGRSSKSTGRLVGNSLILDGANDFVTLVPRREKTFTL